MRMHSQNTDRANTFSANLPCDIFFRQGYCFLTLTSKTHPTNITVISEQIIVYTIDSVRGETDAVNGEKRVKTGG